MLFVIFPLLLLIFYLSLIFAGLITVCLGVFLLGSILVETVCAFWTWLTISFPMLGKFSGILFKYFLRSFLSSPYWTPIIQMLELDMEQ